LLALNFLGEYIEKHFGDEEKLQLEYQYPHYKWHKEMHSWYIAEFYRLKEEYVLFGATEEFLALLNKSMTNWILKHISNVDADLGKYIVEQRRKQKVAAKV
jgi:hemerythrin-like metal-binding protein